MARLNPPCAASHSASALPETQGTVPGLQRSKRQAQGFSSNTHCSRPASSTRSKHRASCVKLCPPLSHARSSAGHAVVSPGLPVACVEGMTGEGMLRLGSQSSVLEIGNGKTNTNMPSPSSSETIKEQEI